MYTDMRVGGILKYTDRANKVNGGIPMKVIKVSDEVHARLVTGAKGSIGNYIEELLNKSSGNNDEFMNDLVRRLDIVLLKLEGGLEKERPKPARSEGMVTIRTPQVIDADIAKLDADELEELDMVQDPETAQRIHSRYENKRLKLQEEKSDFFNDIKIKSQGRV